MEKIDKETIKRNIENAKYACKIIEALKLQTITIDKINEDKKFYAEIKKKDFTPTTWKEIKYSLEQEAISRAKQHDKKTALGDWLISQARIAVLEPALKKTRSPGRSARLKCDDKTENTIKQLSDLWKIGKIVCINQYR